VYNRVFKPWVPLSLLSTGAKLDAEGYKVVIIDQRTDKEWKKRLTGELGQNPICVGVTSMTGSQILGALEATETVKTHNPRIPLIWGGVHASIFPRETLKHPQIDLVVKHEGEETFFQLVKRLEAGESMAGLAGVCYKENGEYRENPDRPFIDLDQHPEPAYHLINIEDYLHSYFNDKQVLELESSRGCPFSCGFCYNALYNKRLWRPLSAERVVGRIVDLHQRYGIEAFHFIDDAFFIDRQRANKIMQMLAEEKLGIRLGFQGIRVDTFVRMGKDTLDLMDRAGVKFLQFGVESGSTRILQLINKRIKVEDVAEINRSLAAYPAIIPYYNFMCGFPSETTEDVFMSTKLAW